MDKDTVQISKEEILNWSGVIFLIMDKEILNYDDMDKDSECWYVKGLSWFC